MIGVQILLFHYIKVKDVKMINFMGITILNCLGKLFTGAINHRLKEFLKRQNVIEPEKEGFNIVVGLHYFIFLYLKQLLTYIYQPPPKKKEACMHLIK